MTAQEATDAASSNATTACTMGLASSTSVQTDKSLGIPPLHEKILGDGTRLQRARIKTRNSCLGVDQLFAAPHDRLLEMYCRTAQALKLRGDENFIMQYGGPQKIHRHVCDHELQLPLGKQARLINAHCPQPLGSAALHEFQVIGVVNDPARIGILPINRISVGIARRRGHLLSVPEQRQ